MVMLGSLFVICSKLHSRIEYLDDVQRSHWQLDRLHGR